MIYVLSVLAGLIVLYFIYFAILIRQAATTPLYHPDVPERREGMEIREFIYREGDGFPWKGRYYSPAGGAADSPCVVFYHGEMPDFINPKPADWRIFDDYGKLLASKGIPSVVFNHRSSKNTRKAAPAREDLLDLLKYIRQDNDSPGFDRDNIILWAFSGGPYICLNWLIKEKPDFIKGMISFYGVLEGKEQGESAIELISKEASPQLPPLMLVKAEKDRVRSSIKAAENFYEAAKDKTDVTLLSHPGPHGFDVLAKTEETIDILNKTLDFVRSDEKAQHTEQNGEPLAQEHGSRTIR